MPHVFGTGLVAFDLIVEHRQGARTLSASGGGTCGNVLTILAHMGWSAHWLGALDSSVAGQIVHDEMTHAGVEMHVLTDREGDTTPIFAHHVEISEGGEPLGHWFSQACPICARALPKYSRPADTWLCSHADRMREADVFFLDRLSDGALELARAARASAALVVYEPSTKDDTPWLDEMLLLADVVKFSHDRREALSSAARSSAHSQTIWIETRGGEGLAWSRGFAPDRMQPLPAQHNPQLVDACGAGDWFTSGLLYGLCQHIAQPGALRDDQLTQILEDASRLASWSCGFMGARGALYDAPFEDLVRHMPGPISASKKPRRSSLSRPTLPENVCGYCLSD